MTLEIAPELQSFVIEAVNAGRYQNSDAVVEAGLRLLRQRDEQLHELKALVQAGADQIARGEGTFIPAGKLRDYFDRLADRVDAELEKQRRAAS